MVPVRNRFQHSSQRPYSTYPTITVSESQLPAVSGSFDCPHCDRRYNYASTRDRHRRAKHQIEPERRRRRRLVDAARCEHENHRAVPSAGAQENHQFSTPSHSSSSSQAPAPSSAVLQPVPQPVSPPVSDFTPRPFPDFPEPGQPMYGRTRAPFMRMQRLVSDSEARRHGFESADEWRKWTLDAQVNGLTFILALPHETFEPLPEAIPSSELSLSSAAEETTMVPPTPGAASARQTPLTLAPETPPPYSHPVGSTGPRRSKKVRKAVRLTASARAQSMPGYLKGRYAGGQARARSILGQMLQERMPPDTSPSQSGTDVLMPVPEGNPSVLTPDLGPASDWIGVFAPNVPADRHPRGPPELQSRSANRSLDLPGYPHDVSSFLQCEDYDDRSPGDAVIFQEDDLPPEAKRVPASVKRMIRDAHRNLGHPSNFALVRIMRTAKCHPDHIAYARFMTCPTCARRQIPCRMPRGSMQYRPTRFNAVVGMDLKEVHDSNGKSFYCLNILDLATSFNVIVLLPNKSASEVAAAYKWAWLTWAGIPDKIVTDKGREFFGDFQEVQALLGVKFKMIPVEAPWQNGMVERHGGVMGDIIAAIVSETGAMGFTHMRDVCLHASMAKNRRPGKTGYSP